MTTSVLAVPRDHRSTSAAAVLRAVLARGPLARDSLAELTGISPAGVSRQCASLMRPRSAHRPPGSSAREPPHSRAAEDRTRHRRRPARGVRRAHRPPLRHARRTRPARPSPGLGTDPAPGRRTRADPRRDRGTAAGIPAPPPAGPDPGGTRGRQRRLGRPGHRRDRRTFLPGLVRRARRADPGGAVRPAHPGRRACPRAGLGGGDVRHRPRLRISGAPVRRQRGRRRHRVRRTALPRPRLGGGHRRAPPARRTGHAVRLRPVRLFRSRRRRMGGHRPCRPSVHCGRSRRGRIRRPGRTRRPARPCPRDRPGGGAVVRRGEP